MVPASRRGGGLNSVDCVGAGAAQGRHRNTELPQIPVPIDPLAARPVLLARRRSLSKVILRSGDSSLGCLSSLNPHLPNFQANRPGALLGWGGLWPPIFGKLGVL